MLCGRLPFLPEERTNPDVSLRRKHVEETPLPPSRVYPQIPRQLDELVLRAMEKHPGRRFQSTAEFKQAILALDRTLELGLTVEPTAQQLAIDTNPIAADTRAAGVSTAPGVGATAATTRSGSSAPTVRGFATAAAQATETPARGSLLKYLILAALLVVFAATAGALIVPKIFKSGPAVTSTAAEQNKEAAPPAAPPGMVFIPGGSFLMGRDLTAEEVDFAVENSGRREKVFVYDYPAHEVAVKPFFLEQTELPNRAYAEFLRALNRPIPQGWEDYDPPAGAEDLPVTNVTYRDAVDYCEWRTQRRKDGFSYRLPTEEEWEFAARGPDAGEPGKQMNFYPWGDEWNVKNANTLEARLNHPQIVTANVDGASPFGVLNLAGNVYEWTSTDFKHYPGSDRQTPQEAGYQGTYQVVRGGAFAYPKEYALTTTRMWAKPVSSGPKLGFRCAANAQR
jgi:formylglycine-generating enzyme required for sulfatase activity